MDNCEQLSSSFLLASLTVTHGNMGHIMANLVQSHAIHTLYNDHQGWLHNWLRHKLGNTWDAADLVHDTFVKILLKDEWGFIREPRAYLTTIAHGLMVNSLRRKDLE